MKVPTKDSSEFVNFAPNGVTTKSRQRQTH